MTRFLVPMRSVLVVGLLLSGCTESDGPSLLGSESGTPAGFLTFTNGQAALVVVGQPNFTASGSGTSATQLQQPEQGVLGRSGRFWVTDALNARVLGYHAVPTSNGTAADFVIGQTNFTNQTTGFSATEMQSPSSVSDNGVQLFIADRANKRVQVFNTIPSADTPTADFSIGAPDPNSQGPSTCTQNTMMEASNVFATTQYLYVSDQQCSRVLIFSLPITSNQPNAIRVLGQSNFTNSAPSTTQSGFDSPDAIWSDDTKILVADMYNNRVMIFNSFPTVDGQNADLVLGQANFTSKVGGPTTRSSIVTANEGITGVTSNGTQVFVSDPSSARVLIWNSWPTSNRQNADVVLGQPDFTSNSWTTTQNGFGANWFLSVDSQYLTVSDPFANRILIWRTQ